MAWQFESGLPIYRQLVDRIRMMIAGGEFKPGDRIPAVRELALEAGVNPNTMQKALGDLEREGLVYTQRTSGKTVTEDEALIRQMRESIAADETRTYLLKLKGLGMDASDGIKLVQKAAALVGSYDTGDL